MSRDQWDGRTRPGPSNRNWGCFPICSLCKQVFAAGAWLELDEAIERLGRFDSTRVPRLEQTVCETCRALGNEAQGGGSAA